MARDVTAGATGATAVASKFLDVLTLFQPGGQILPNISEVAPMISSWLHLCNYATNHALFLSTFMAVKNFFS